MTMYLGYIPDPFPSSTGLCSTRCRPRRRRNTRRTRSIAAETLQLVTTRLRRSAERGRSTRSEIMTAMEEQPRRRKRRRKRRVEEKIRTFSYENNLAGDS